MHLHLQSIHQRDHHVIRGSWTHYFVDGSTPYQLSQPSLLVIPILIDWILPSAKYSELLNLSQSAL